MELFSLDEDAAAIAVSWLQSLARERQMSPKTVEAYHRDLQQFGRFLAAHLGKSASISDLSQLTSSDFRSFLAARRNRDIQSRTLARQISTLRSFFSFAARQGHFKNPALSAVRPPKLPHRLPRPLTISDATQAAQGELIDGDATPWIKARNRAVFMLLYACGLRISEALTLTRQDFKRDPMMVKGKGGKERLVPLLPEVRTAVDAYAALCPFELNATDALFRGAKGGPLSARVVQLLMQQMRGALGLTDSATPHALRHSFASHMLSAGADLRVIQELLGHASLSSTQIYTDVNRTHLMTQYKKAFG